MQVIVTGERGALVGWIMVGAQRSPVSAVIQQVPTGGAQP